MRSMRPDWSLASIKKKLEQLRRGAPDESRPLRKRRTSDDLAEITTAVTEAPRQTLGMIRRSSSLTLQRSFFSILLNISHWFCTLSPLFLIFPMFSHFFRSHALPNRSLGFQIHSPNLLCSHLAGLMGRCRFGVVRAQRKSSTSATTDFQRRIIVR